jgi:hypothetical protein
MQASRSALRIPGLDTVLAARRIQHDDEALDNSGTTRVLENESGSQALALSALASRGSLASERTGVSERLFTARSHRQQTVFSPLF